MRDVMAYGGPDNAGDFFDTQTPLAFGHRRLSILDLSAAGNQPMHWQHWTMIFNGEIYNFTQIRKELEALGHSFVSNNDTEVLLKGYQQWGIQPLLSRLRGMFAFALWDAQKQQLTICRDRVGVKPMFWYWRDGLLLFGSELKAFHQHPHFDKTLAPSAISLFLQQGYINQPHCIYQYAQQLPAGCYLEIDQQQRPNIHRYWDAEKCYAESAPLQGNEQELTNQLESLLLDSFQLRMVSDVPVGVFLSGGIDSSTVAALLQKNSSQPLKTFTIGFNDEQYNEAQHAKAVAQHLGTEHHELYCTEEDFKQIIPSLPDMYDQPLGDSSAIPTHLVARMARERVTVSLSADGGDELFGGYTKYEVTQQFYPKIRRMPAFIRAMMRGMLGVISPMWLERNSHRIPVLKRYKNISNKLPKLLHALQAQSPTEFFQLASSYISPEQLGKMHTAVEKRFAPTVAAQPDRQIGYWGLIDILTYLEGDILNKVDRATMQVALEGRDPFLDHQVIEFALRLPDQWKIRNGVTKYLLRQVLYRHVPQQLIERPKQGFSVPIQSWLLGVLRQELAELSNDAAFEETLGLKKGAVRLLITQFLQQKRYTNPHFVWFVYTLWRWWHRWK